MAHRGATARAEGQERISRTRAIQAAGVAVVLCAAPAQAQVILMDGDDLQAAVTAAPSGTVIEIQSNDTFLGTLSWTGKDITIQAGAGFTPTIKGDPGSGVVSLSNSSPPTVATFIDLSLVRGDDFLDPFTGQTITPSAFSFSGTSLNPEFIVATFTDCDVTGRISSSGTGMHRFTGTLTRTTIEGDVSLGGTGSLVQDVVMEECTIAGRLILSGTGSLVVDADLLDSTVDMGVLVSTTGSAMDTLEVRRSRISGSVSASAISSSSISLLVESSLVLGGGSGTGISLSGTTVGRLVNNTVTGFNTGIQGTAGSTWENMLLYGNGGLDVGTGVTSVDIANSLISDGSFAGVNGNFAATPVVDTGFGLLAGAPGVDAGNNAAADLGPFDLNGTPRIQDGDGDGTATVNVGAVETVGGLPASATLVNGSGVNPVDYTVISLPVIGTSYSASIATNVATVATVVGVDQPAPAPFLLPGLASGEILLALSPALFLHPANGIHSIPVPNDPALIGIPLSTQGFRIELTGIVPMALALNGIDLVVGI